MDICDKYLDDARKALKGSMFSKPDPTEAVRSYEGAAQCFENFKNYERAAQCYVETANLVARMDPLKAADMLERAASCMVKSGGSPGEFYLQAASIYKDHAIALYKTNPDQGLQLLLKAAESFEKGGDRKTAVQCYDVGAEVSLKRKDYLNALVFYGNAAQSFERSREYEKAVKYYHKVAQIWDIQKVPSNVAENYLRMATSLENLQQFDYSIQFYVKAAEKYEEAQEIYKSAKSYEKAATIQESIEKFNEASESFTKAAELIKTLKNMDKFEELYNKTAECYTKAGESEKGVKIHLMLADAFADDPYRCSVHFEKAISFTEGNPSMKMDLLLKQGEALVQLRDYLRAARSYEEAAELSKEMGESPSELYKKAGDAYVLFAKGMERVKNQPKAKEGYEYAVSCFEKAGMVEEGEKVQQYLRPDMSEREKQVLQELERLKADYKSGILPENVYNQIKEGYNQLLKGLKQ